MTVKAAAEALEAALREAGEGTWGVSRDPAVPGQLPAVVIGPPSLEWGTGFATPTEARFLVYVIVDANERALEVLWELVPQVAAAIDTVTNAVVKTADPTAYQLGTSEELPAYQILTEVSLQ